MKNRLLEIQSQGVSDNLSQNNRPSYDFKKLRPKEPEGANLIINGFSKINSRLGDKAKIRDAIWKKDLDTLKDMSLFYSRTSGIYRRLIDHLSNFYRYDWLVTPYKNSDAVKNEAVIDGFAKVLNYFDNSRIKQFFSASAYQVLKFGCYYGYRLDQGTFFSVQELPARYCRSRFAIAGKPVVEFQMKYFDDKFKDDAQRQKILQCFPAEFLEGYKLYRQNKLPPEFQGDTSGWYMLDPKKAFKFNLDSEDYPEFISVIPHIIDLEEAQELDKKRMEQKLLRLIIQKMPLDKNGELIFDPDEAKELHNNAVQMLGKALGLRVLTTFADVDVADTSDKGNVSSRDELEKVERSVYNESGTAQNLFNTDGNIALEKSLANDEASLTRLILQFEAFLNDALEQFNKNPKKIYYRAQILPTTAYNYKELSKLYKEQTAMGFSKMLPQVALGQSQSSILATAYFENEVLNLADILVPPSNTNTMSGNKGGSNPPKEDKKAGRTEKPDDEKSEKTIANRESMS